MGGGLAVAYVGGDPVVGRAAGVLWPRSAAPRGLIGCPAVPCHHFPNTKIPFYSTIFVKIVKTETFSKTLLLKMCSKYCTSNSYTIDFT